MMIVGQNSIGIKTQSYNSRVCDLLGKINLEGKEEVEKAVKSSTLAYESKVATLNKLLAPPTKKEAKKMVPITNEILLYLSTLNITMFDVIAEYEEVGWFRQTTKKNLNLAAKKVREVFDEVYNTIARNETDKRGTTSYNSAMMDVYNVINEAILLKAPERSWNVAIALIRLMLKLNDTLGNYEVVEVRKLTQVMKMLCELGNTPSDYHLDNLVQITLKKHF